MKRMLAGIAIATIAMALVSCGGGGDGGGIGLLGTQGSSPASTAAAVPGPEQRASAKVDDLSAVQGLAPMQADSAGGVAAALAQGDQGRASLLERAQSAAELPPIAFDASLVSAPIDVKIFERQTVRAYVWPVVNVKSKLPSGAALYIADNEQNVISDWEAGRAVPLWPDGTGNFYAPLGWPISTLLPRGTYNGALKVEVCRDSCLYPYPTSTPPVLVPYSITVLPPFEVSVEVNGVPVPFQPHVSGPANYIEVKTGDKVVIRSAEAVSWDVGSAGVAFSDRADAQKSWTATLGLTQPEQGLFSVRAMIFDKMPAPNFWSIEVVDFRVTR